MGQSSSHAQARREAELQEEHDAQVAFEMLMRCFQIREERRAAVRREQEKQRKLWEEYPRPAFLPDDGVETIAVVGETGVGKSSFINALLGRYVAETGCYETTELPPKIFEVKLKGKNVRIADMPGGGTETYTSKTYFRHSGMRHFSSVLVVAAGKPRQLTLESVRHLEKNGVQVTLVVNKMDSVVHGAWVTDAIILREAFSETKISYEQALKAVGSSCPVFLISAVDVLDKKRQHSPRAPALRLPAQDNDSINRQWNSLCERLETNT